MTAQARQQLLDFATECDRVCQAQWRRLHEENDDREFTIAWAKTLSDAARYAREKAASL